MSGPRITDAAVEAGAEALAIFGVTLADRADSRMVLTAALPHIRRAVIEGLVEKLDTRIESLASQVADCFDRDEAYALGDDLDHYGSIRDWLRAELEGDGE